MQRLAGPPSEQPAAENALDDVGFVLLGNRWKRKNIPVFLLEHVPDQVILTHPLHNYDVASRSLVIEAGHQRTVIPFIHAPSPLFVQPSLPFYPVLPLVSTL